MIQRWQTLFLFLVIVSCITMFFYPVATITEFTQLNTETLETDYYELNITGIHDPSPTSPANTESTVTIPMLILTLIIGATAGYAVFSYRSRLLQLRLVKIAIFVNIILIGAIFLNYTKLFTHIPVSVDLSTGAYFPLISLVLLVVSHRYILKDEKLVRSADRLR